LRRAPRIAIVADVQRVGTQERYTVDRIPVDTIIRVLRAEPVIVPPIEGVIGTDDLLDRVEGFFINGGTTNIRPERYGKQCSPDYAPFDEARDGFVLPLIPQILERGIPLLVTCRGFQELNVALGGTLCKERDDLPEEQKHGTPGSAKTEDERYRVRHKLNIHAGGVLARAIGEKTVMVNSLHSQLIERLAPDLIVEASAEDGTIEAARPRNAPGFALGTIFHPEYWAEKDEPSAAVLGAYSEAVQAYAARRQLAQAAE
jgi:putative glutamine amidotransferase